MAKLSERRVHPRYAQDLAVRFTILGGTLPPDPEERVGKVVNIGQGGIVLDQRRPLKEGAVLQIDLPATVFGSARRLYARVKWVKPTRTVGKPWVGCEFVSLTPEELVQVRQAGLHVPDGERVHAAPGWLFGSGRERRKFERTEAALGVRVLDPRTGKAGTWHGATLENISQGGVQLSTTFALLKGDLLDIRFPESALGPARTLPAKVMWARRADLEGRITIGCAYLR